MQYQNIITMRSHRWQSLQYLLQQSPFEFPRFATDILYISGYRFIKYVVAIDIWNELRSHQVQPCDRYLSKT
ncbi:MAG: hypothetical protein V7L27_25205 [Nostoc sp.]|uniref:hypothetical protein n=1 Tax=Nostoc sp. TaxID=1180 RepID=UPI002FF89D27